MTAADTYAKARRYNRMPPEPPAPGPAVPSPGPAYFTPACVHFVGFRGEEYWSARRVWGRPDFFHRHWDERVMGDVVEGVDTVVFAKGDETSRKTPFTFNDSEVF